MRRMTFLSSAPWDGKNQAREINTKMIPERILFLMGIENLSFLRSNLCLRMDDFQIFESLYHAPLSPRKLIGIKLPGFEGPEMNARIFFSIRNSQSQFLSV